MNQQPPYPPQQHWQQPGPGRPRNRRRTNLIILSIIGGCLVLFAGCTAILAALAPDETTRLVEDAAATSTVPPATTKAPATTAKPATTKPKPAEIGPGTYEVGVDIRPGTYVSAGADADGVCYWARLKDFDGGLDSIIANDLSDSGRQRVTIRSSDKGFETSGCQPWVRQ